MQRIRAFPGPASSFDTSTCLLLGRRYRGKQRLAAAGGLSGNSITIPRADKHFRFSDPEKLADLQGRGIVTG